MEKVELIAFTCLISNYILFKVPNEDAVDFIFVMDTLNFSFWPDDPSSKFTVSCC